MMRSMEKVAVPHSMLYSKLGFPLDTVENENWKKKKKSVFLL